MIYHLLFTFYYCMYKNFIIALIFLMIGYQPLIHGQDIDSVDVKKEYKAVEIIGIAVPAAMIAYGLISLDDNEIRKIDFNVRNSLENNNRFMNVEIDDYLQYAPLIAAYTMKFCKVKSAHNLLDMTIFYGLSNIITAGVVQGTKRIIERERPDYSDKLSFPSGHTSTAFVAAEFLYQEYKDKSIWIGIGGYSLATFVGIARIYENRHWVSDVVAGAGIGILSTKAVYWAYPHLLRLIGKNEQDLNTYIYPGYSNGNLTIALSHRF